MIGDHDDDPEPYECPDVWHVVEPPFTDECPTCGDTDPLDGNN